MSNEAKVRFVTEHAVGGSALEVVAVLLSAPLLAAASTALRRVLRPVVCDMVGVVLPMVLLCTVGAPLVPLAALATVALVLRPAASAGPQSDARPALTVFRGAMMLFTCVCILAVDFAAFPRRFGKTETVGFSLMDTGVGLFVFSSGLFESRRQGAWQRALPLAALGAVRLVVTWAVGYHQHTSEYGTHWNFFFTLGVVHLCNVGFSSTTWRMLAALVVLVVHQAYLLQPGMLEWLFEAPRVSLWSHNREGIVSCAGFFGVFLLGQAMRPWMDSPAAALAVGIVSGMASAAVHMWVQPASRRVANAAYGLFVVCCGTLLVASLRRMGATPGPVVAAASGSQLAVFLIANLCTGAVNLTLNTLAASTGTTLVVLFLYATVLAGAAFTLARRRAENAQSTTM